jgi:hypothetical protein
VKLHVFFDQDIVEVFGGDGETGMTTWLDFGAEYRGLAVLAIAARGRRWKFGGKMQTTVLRFKLIYRLMPGICFVVFGVFIVWLSRIMPPLTFNDPLEVMLLILWLMFFVMLLFLGYVNFFYWKYRLEFDETHVRLRTPVFGRMRPFTCAYGDIVRIQRGPLRGTLAIVPREG